MKNERSEILIAVGLAAELQGHELMPWVKLPDDTLQTYCNQCLNTVWVGEDVISFLDRFCEVEPLFERGSRTGQS